MKHLSIDKALTTRTIPRADDTDYFIETYSYPVHLDAPLHYLSRIQFPTSRAILIRTSPSTSWITIHVLQDVDLYSSFANFEVNLTTSKISLTLKEGYITLHIEETL